MRDGGQTNWLRAATGLARARQFDAAEGGLVVLHHVGASAQVSVRLPMPATATLMDGATGRVVRTFDAPENERLDIDVPGPADVYDPGLRLPPAMMAEGVDQTAVRRGLHSPGTPRSRRGQRVSGQLTE